MQFSGTNVHKTIEAWKKKPKEINFSYFSSVIDI